MGIPLPITYKMLQNLLFLSYVLFKYDEMKINAT
jgi:hypothetical protein